MIEGLEKKRIEIARKLGELGRRIEDGDDSELLVWIIPDKLACAHRPLRHNRLYGGSSLNLDPDATPFIFEWSMLVQIEGIKSIICLMYQSEIDLYNRLDLGAENLIEFYKQQGFDVAHIPWEDPAHSKTSWDLVSKKLEIIRRDALNAYDKLEKPVLLHCSADIDRSSPVAAYIWQQRAL